MNTDWKYNFPKTRYVRLSVGRFVGLPAIIFLKRREVTLLCLYRSTCYNETIFPCLSLQMGIPVRGGAGQEEEGPNQGKLSSKVGGWVDKIKTAKQFYIEFRVGAIRG